ncbi:type I polyketide synthase [Ethanoligenens harbinense]|uniref:6-deoxyerythronolide-B synthase n=2 Tax=Ethanoligenens harbinense TaxID=253239 RepID=E6U7B9_ETHHY|nr:type I polyketide synthase [Ethanoligenens harbinense]ADU25854.1 6-deoxyerythronolide-B synthase [Ethanoligenens harbinense YUAN-3]AVQ95014.1 hypothetical protein CXQ68_01375 [Ethanoligenens harbinense YUAN-3]AYF40426.1 hypothetical protein CN246_01375 [Ethanoligenens harbinense]
MNIKQLRMLNPGGTRPAGPENRADDGIAVIGIGLNMPFADTPDTFWDHIENGIDCNRPISSYRKKLCPPVHQAKPADAFHYASYLEEIDGFDGAFFGLTPREAMLMNPAERLFLETVQHTLEDAGCVVGSENRSVGVFVGLSSDIEWAKYRELVRQTEPEYMSSGIEGLYAPMVAGYASYYFDLHGPSQITDTACSSSLVALHNACTAIRGGECDMALAGGLRVMTLPVIDPNYRFGIESSDGFTRSFDAGADGSGTGEGVAAVLLKRQSDAVRDRDHIYAVIRGSGVNHNGRSMGVTVTSPEAQGTLLSEIWRKAGIDPEQIGFLETHGTGTPLGDPIEIDGIANAFARFTDRKQFCAISSVKTMLGHLYDCAGITSLIEAVLALSRRKLPPLVHFNRPNRALDLMDSPVYINTKCRAWESDHPRLCGVNSFGVSGTNCHVLLEEATPSPAPAAVPAALRLFVLSAKTECTLKRYCDDYLAFLRAHRNISVDNLCYTAAVGRKAYACRFAACVDSVSALSAALDRFRSGRADGSFFCNTPGIAGPTGLDGGGSELERIGKLYCSGRTINWTDVFSGGSFQKLSLPVYPFEHVPLWPKLMSGDHREFYFRFAWRERALARQETAQKQPVLFCSDGSAQAEAIRTALVERGVHAISTRFCKRFEKRANSEYSLGSSAEDSTAFLREMQEGRWKKIVFFRASEKSRMARETLDALKETVENGLYRMLSLVKAIEKQDVSQKAEFIVVTDRAEEVTGEETELHPENAMYSSLGKTVNQECCRVKCRVIDLDEHTSPAAAVDEILFGKDQAVALRNDRRLIQRLEPVHLHKTENGNDPFREGGVYVITGGSGALAAHVAKWIAARRGTHLILIGRSPIDPGHPAAGGSQAARTLETMEAIRALGSSAEYIQADVADERAAAEAFDRIRRTYGRLNGVIHMAGITGNRMIVNMERSDFETVLAPKVFGTWNIDRLTQGDDLDFFLLFSSGVSFIGETGLAAYAAANQFLNSFAQCRRRTRSVQAFDWVVWENQRMMDGYSRNVDGWFEQIRPNDALACMRELMPRRESGLLIGRLNRKNRYEKSMFSHLPFEVSEEVQRMVRITERAAAPDHTETGRRAASPHPADPRTIEGTLTGIFREVLGYQEIDIHDNFFDLGGNSILLKKLHQKVDEAFPGQVEVADFFAYTTVSKMAAHLAQTAGPATATMQEAEKPDDKLLELIDSIDSDSDVDAIVAQIENM